MAVWNVAVYITIFLFYFLKESKGGVPSIHDYIMWFKESERLHTQVQSCSHQ